MITKSVAVSGTVGKQVFAITKAAILKGYSVFVPTSAATVTIRSGNASGDIIHQSHGAILGSPEFVFPDDIRFDRGMHVKVLGVGSTAYLYIN